MARRRMFTKEIVESDAFLAMPLSTQALYFHYGMAADDFGVINSPKRILRYVGAAEDDYKLLLAKRFIIEFPEDEVIVIKHWKMNNYIQKDHLIPTNYPDIIARLGIDENKAYTTNEAKMDKKCIQNGRLGKESIEEISLDKSISVESVVDKVSKGEGVTMEELMRKRDEMRKKRA